MSYVLAVVTQFAKQNEVRLKARGRSISTAVDVAEIIRKRFVADAKIANIEIGTDEIVAENEKINVSTIDILLKK